MTKTKLTAETLRTSVTTTKWVFFSLVILFIILGIMRVSLAADGTSTALCNGDALCEFFQSSIYPWVQDLVLLIAVVMVIAAGIVYTFDLGGGKQINLAKDMLISAISGLLLFFLASWLLLQLNGLFPEPPAAGVTGGPPATGLPPAPGDGLPH